MKLQDLKTEKTSLTENNEDFFKSLLAGDFPEESQLRFLKKIEPLIKQGQLEQAFAPSVSKYIKLLSLENRQKFAYIYADYVEILVKKSKVDVEVRQETVFFDKSNSYPVVTVGWDIDVSFWKYLGLFDEKMKSVLAEIINKKLKKIDAEFKLKTKDVDWSKKFNVHLDWRIQQALDLAGIDADSLKICDFVDKKISDRYQNMNSREALKGINSLSGDEQRRAINRHADDIIHLLKNVKLGGGTR